MGKKADGPWILPLHSRTLVEHVINTILRDIKYNYNISRWYRLLTGLELLNNPLGVLRTSRCQDFKYFTRVLSILDIDLGTQHFYQFLIIK